MLRAQADTAHATHMTEDSRPRDAFIDVYASALG